MLATMGVQAERGVWPAPTFAHLDEMVDLLHRFVQPASISVSQPKPNSCSPHFARSVRAALEARKLAEDPERERYATLLASCHHVGFWPGLVRKENLERYEELEAEIGETMYFYILLAYRLLFSPFVTIQCLNSKVERKL